MAGGDNAHNVQYSSILMSGMYGNQSIAIYNQTTQQQHTIPAVVVVIIITLVATCSLPVINWTSPYTEHGENMVLFALLHDNIIIRYTAYHGISRHITAYGVH